MDNSSSESDAAPSVVSGPDVFGVTFGGRDAKIKIIENCILIGFPFLGSIVWLFWIYIYGITWIEISSFIFTYSVVGIGVGVGFHRYFSHKSFEAPILLQWLLGIAGTMAFQGSVLRWVADHRRHHAHTDECGDIHSPLVDGHCSEISTFRGLFHAHIGWMFDNSVTDYRVYAKDLFRDDVIIMLHRSHWIILCMFCLSVYFYGYFLGGWQHGIGCLLFSVCFRTTFFHNSVWAVNSIGHKYGYMNYAMANNSKNNTVLAILTFGEGWHNNHHKFPRSAHHGLKRSEIDINGAIIDTLEYIRVIKNVHRVDHETVA